MLLYEAHGDHTLTCRKTKLKKLHQKYLFKHLPEIHPL